MDNPFKNLDDETLVEEWKSLVLTNRVYGSISVNELYRIAALERELENRENVNPEELLQWELEENEKYAQKQKKEFFERYCTKSPKND